MGRAGFCSYLDIATLRVVVDAINLGRNADEDKQDPRNINSVTATAFRNLFHHQLSPRRMGCPLVVQRGWRVRRSINAGIRRCEQSSALTDVAHANVRYEF